jgi:glutamate dehydrogenase
MTVSARKKRPAAMAGGKNGKLARTFADVFFSAVPDDDIAGWTPADRAQVAETMYDFVRVRAPGAAKVRVYTPPSAGAIADGHLPPTVVEIVGEDMPFVVDSISAELAYRGLHVDTLLHPILNVKRDARGAMVSVSSADLHARSRGGESFLFVRLERALMPEVCGALTTSLRRVLDDVQKATSDWQQMLKRMDGVIQALPVGKGKAAEGRELLSYLRENNFTFLGCREYRFGKDGSIPTEPGLGILKGTDDPGMHDGFAAAIARTPGPVLVAKLVGRHSRVHRRVPLDAVAVKATDPHGRVTGMHLFVGLFTSSTYSCRTSDVPVVREKVQATIARAGFRHGAHDHRALEHILEKMPRDELFQVTADDLYAQSLGILRLQDKHRIALFTHKDPLQQYMSCLVYVPRDRYNTRFRLQAGRILEESLKGSLMTYFTTLDDSPLARVLFMIRLPRGPARPFDSVEAERALIELGREWHERLRDVTTVACGRTRGMELADVYGRAFPTSYQESTRIQSAVHDIRQLEALEIHQENIRVELFRPKSAAPGTARLKIYNRGAPVSLSAIMPVIENMGLSAVSEMPYEVRVPGRDSVWIHDFQLSGANGTDLSAIKAKFEETFLKVWHGHIENDGFNRLVLTAGLSWSEARLMRAFGAYLRQARFPYSGAYMAQVLGERPQIVRALVALFAALHDPKGKGKDTKGIGARIDELIQGVERLDHDRILRLYRQIVEKTLRTNYFQEGKDCVSFKLDSKNFDGLPLPRPMVEIFVFARRVEAVHLRNGMIARGGIRWSDRPDDFRTEILGLMKAQTVKNTVIVPTGAKGGFVVKQPPKEREAFQAEGIECYKVFVQALLDLTDNNVKGKVVRPRGVFCHDGPDPYLVVAADKGTAKFSNIANALSQKAGFWLDDAFASGGSTGYDHKEIGITARGGWESVKRHFRELGKDVQAELFTAVGVGDMGGDVFGNGALLSKQMKLVGAFNHVHIFCDPEPDPAASWAERARLFKGVLGWDSYDTTKLSPGGAVYNRSSKTLKLTPQIKKRFGLTHDNVPPDELMRAILKADAELVWFGGIGTFIKSSKQSHADADDKTNDALRVDAAEIRAKVVGEGANLGVTQLGRVEYARKGGRINTDFIDNSGGVDCSDHEVNIKILLNAVLLKSKLTLPKRNKLLERMTDDVAALVLRDNYQQNLSLTLQQHTAKELAGVHAELVRSLEKSGLIKRGLEGLPDEEGFTRLAREGQGLTRPELCVLMSWAKIALFNDVIESAIPDDPALEWMLFDYFPPALRHYKTEIRAHRLRREIIATQVVNILVNRMGAAFVHSRIEKTGASTEEVVRAFLIVMEAFGLKDLWSGVEALDNKVAGSAQIVALHEIYQLGKRAVTWMLRFGQGKADIGREIRAFRPGIDELRRSLVRFLPESSALTLRAAAEKFESRGVPPALATDLSVFQRLSSACDIITLSRRTKGAMKTAAAAYFLTGERLSIDWLKTQAAAVVPANSWQSRVIGSLLDEYYMHQATIAAEVIRAPRWFDQNAEVVERFEQMVTEMKAHKPDLDMLVLAGQRLGQIAAGLGV